MSKNTLEPGVHVEGEQSSFPERAYTFGIITLAAVLLALAFFRPSGGDVTVESALNIARASAGPLNPISAEQLQSELRSPEVINQVINGIPKDIVSIARTGAGNSWLEDVAHRITVESEAVGPESVNIKLQSTGRFESFQRRLVEQLHNYVREAHDAPLDMADLQASYDEARGKVVKSIEQLDLVQTRMETFADERIQLAREEFDRRVQEVVDKVVKDRESSEPVPTASAGLPEVEAVNPQWQEIEQELEQLKAQESELLRPGADAKPRDDSNIAELTQLLEQTPMTIKVMDGVIDNPFVHHASHIQQVAQLESSEAASDQSLTAKELLRQIPKFDERRARQSFESDPKYAALLGEFEVAQKARDAALDLLGAKVDPRTAVSTTVSTITAVDVTNRKSGKATLPYLLRLLLPCALIGGISAWLRKQPDPPDTFISPEDVEEWLDFPVIGVATTGDGPTIPAQSPPATPRPIFFARRVSEVLVCAALLVVIYCVGTVPGFSKEVWRNPLAGYTEAIDHLTRSFM